MVGMYLSRETTKHTLYEIAATFQRHHTAIIHGHSTIESYMEIYPELERSIDYLVRGEQNNGLIPPAFMPYANCNI